MQHIQTMLEPLENEATKTKERNSGSISLERTCEIDNNREARAKMFLKNHVYLIYSTIKKRFSKDVQYPFFSTPPFSTSTPPSSLDSTFSPGEDRSLD